MISMDGKNRIRDIEIWIFIIDDWSPEKEKKSLHLIISWCQLIY